jgi:hypothetical protein
MHESPKGSTLVDEATQLSPKRKRRDGKIPLLNQR